MANATALTLNALRSLAVVRAKIQMCNDVQASVGTIQGSPRTSLPQHLPTGSMAIMRNQGICFSMSGMFPEPGGVDTFHAVGAFQHDNLLRGLIDCWQAPDALRWAKHAINGGRPILVWQPCIIGLFLRGFCCKQISKLPPLSHRKRFTVPRE